MTVPDWVKLVSDETPDKLFTKVDGHGVTYADLTRAAGAIGGALRERGVAAGDRVAILQRNGLGFALDFLGAMWAGAVPVPVSWRSSPSDWAYVVKHSGAKVVLTGDGFAASLEGELSEDVLIVTRDGGATGASLGHSEFLASRMSDLPQPLSRSWGDAYQIYTSGTTSRPKGVVGTHAALMACVQQLGALHRSAGVLGGRLLASPPMFHSGITVHWLTTAVYGGEVHFLREFEVGRLVDAVIEEQIEFTMLMPTMLELTMRGSSSPDLSSLKLVIYGGQNIAVDTFRRAQKFFGASFLQLYGLSETNPATVLTPEDHRSFDSHPHRTLSAGRPIPGTELEIRSAAGVPLPHGVQGEVFIRCPQQMSSYWADPEKTESTLVDGWIRTGDAGHLDEDGYLYVEGRVDDMIVSGAENIFPLEIEDVIALHPAVLEVAVVGLPHPVWGQQVTAAVVWRAAPGDLTELSLHCRERLPGFKCPKEFVSVPDLPRNATGKVLRRQVASSLHAAPTAAS